MEFGRVGSRLESLGLDRRGLESTRENGVSMKGRVNRKRHIVVLVRIEVDGTNGIAGSTPIATAHAAGRSLLLLGRHGVAKEGNKRKFGLVTC